MAARLRRIRQDQAGSTLIEVVIAGVLLVMVAVGVFGAFDAATRGTAEERHRARAHGIAQDDLSRMRSMRISDLSNLNQTRTVNQDGTDYTIQSRADFVTDTTGTASCEEGVSSADYLKVTSTVTWSSIGTRPPVVAATIVAPPNGSVSANSGGLAIGIEDSQNAGIPGIGVSGTGAGSFSGTTDENGCAMFGNLPAGDYTLSLSGIASGLVDRDGNPPQAQDISVVGESTNTVVFQYDSPGTIDVDFVTRIGGTLVPATADSVIFFNTGMTAGRLFGTPGTQASGISGTSLFPFSSPYAVYAGTCEADNPNPDDDPAAPGAAASASVLLSPTGSATATIEMPALHVTVWSGTSSTPGSPVPGATLTVEDDFCPDVGGSPFWRTFTTDASGQVHTGLPWSRYDLCATDPSATDRRTANNVTVQNLSVGTTVNIYLGGTPGGSCP